MQVRHIAWLTFLVRVAAAKGHAIVQNVLAGGVPVEVETGSGNIEIE